MTQQHKGLSSHLQYFSSVALRDSQAIRCSQIPGFKIPTVLLRTLSTGLRGYGLSDVYERGGRKKKVKPRRNKSTR